MVDGAVECRTEATQRQEQGSKTHKMFITWSYFMVRFMIASKSIFTVEHYHCIILLHYGEIMINSVRSLL